MTKLDLSDLTVSQKNAIRYLGYKPVVLNDIYAIGVARSKNGAAIVVRRKAQAEKVTDFTANDVTELPDRFLV